MSSNDYTFKVVLIGGASVGKSAIFRRYMEGGFEKNSSATITASYLEKKVEIPGSDNFLKIQSLMISYIMIFTFC